MQRRRKHFYNNRRTVRKQCFLLGPPGYITRRIEGVASGCECWNTKIKDKTQAIYFSHRLRSPEAHLTLIERKIPFVNHVNYLSVVFDKRIICRLHIEMFEVKAFRTFIRTYSLLNNERISANKKLTTNKALIISVMTDSVEEKT
jgi:hypothetical protein